MNQRCLPAERDRAHRAARAMERAHTAVLSADVLAPDVDPSNRWTVEATLAGRETVPSAVLQAVVEHDLDVLEAGPRAPDVLRVVAVV
ncbi:MAG: hypothetical protein ACOCY1_03440 [Halovenus sp.]